MSPVTVGCSPHSGQAGFRRRFTLRNSMSMPSKISSFPIMPRPMPRTCLIVSKAIIGPMIPGSTPKTPASAQLGTAPGGGLGLRPAEVVGAVEDLPLQVAGVHHVEVHDADASDAGRGQVHRRGRAESTGAQEQHARVEELALTGAADLGEDQVTSVALD